MLSKTKSRLAADKAGLLGMSIIHFFFFFLLVTQICFSQTQIVKGKLVDHNGLPLRDVSLELYILPDVYNTTSDTAGSFFFSVVTNIKEEGQLPSGYSITNNFPNPFNPKTRIGITLPTEGNVKVGVYNILGQRVIDEIEKYFSAGTHSVDIELEGLPSGIYIARISIDEKYTAVKKMMLIYGSQHLSPSASTFNNQLYKSNNKVSLSTNIDSLVASSLIIGSKTFTSLPGIIGDTLDLGELTIERYCPGLPTITDSRDGKVYNTVLIGDQCWLRENMNIGTRIDGALNQTNNAVIEKYCYDNLETTCTTYGGLYQWSEATTVCPLGWHIPKYAEFETLAETVNYDGNALKAVGQDETSTNASGFSALLAGVRGHDGTFGSLGYYTYFWGAYMPSIDIGSIDALSLDYYGSVVILSNLNLDYGCSVRCLKD